MARKLLRSFCCPNSNNNNNSSTSSTSSNNNNDNDNDNSNDNNNNNNTNSDQNTGSSNRNISISNNNNSSYIVSVGSWRKWKNKSYDVMFPRLMRKGKWEALLSILRSNNSSEQEAVRSFFQQHVQSTREPMLVHACRHRPPLHAIVQLLQWETNSLNYTDCQGRGPLHVACQFKASPHIVQFLLQQAPFLATQQDHSGQTPLHVACRCYERDIPLATAAFFHLDGLDDHDETEDMVDLQELSTRLMHEGNGDKPLEWTAAASLLLTIQEICKTQPAIVHVEDDDHKTALEYGIHAGIPLQAVKLLQKVSEYIWKQQESLQQQQQQQQQQQPLTLDTPVGSLPPSSTDSNQELRTATTSATTATTTTTPTTTAVTTSIPAIVSSPAGETLQVFTSRRRRQQQIRMRASKAA